MEGLEVERVLRLLTDHPRIGPQCGLSKRLGAVAFRGKEAARSHQQIGDIDIWSRATSR